jgi:F420-0:gamma-glutamyl ligase
MQPLAKVYRVGILTTAAGSAETLRQSLRDLGYVESRNVVLDIRDTEGKPERADDLALQLGVSKLT